MNVAFIPVRGGSKSIPLKNIKIIAGQPLVYWTAKAANDCAAIDAVYIATDSEKIKQTVLKMAFDKVHVIGRSAESASDNASTESAMLEFAGNYDFDNIVLIQATSPLLTSVDLAKGFDLFSDDSIDSVLSVVRQKRFIWESTGEYVIAKNYDVFNRPRRQDFDGYFVENGAFYITSRKGLLASKNRLSGRIKAVEMDETSYLEIDEPNDFVIIERLLERRKDQSKAYLAEKTRRIKMVLTDCDGVLTDGGMYYSENGDELKKFNTKDGLGLSELKKHGIVVGIITGETRELNRRRAEKLGLDELVAGCDNKAIAIRRLCDKYKFSEDEIAYIGDDLNDIEAIKIVGLGCCPADANSKAKEVADFITGAKGGEGAVREIADYILARKQDISI